MPQFEFSDGIAPPEVRGQTETGYGCSPPQQEEGWPKAGVVW